MTFYAPDIDYAGLSPVIALTAGICVVLVAGLFRTPDLGPPRPDLDGARRRRPGSASGSGARARTWSPGALRLDELALAAALICIFAAAVCVLLSIREPAAERSGHGEFYSLLLGSVLGMVLLAMAQNLVSFFIALELLSMPLYVLCASAVRREASLESGPQVPGDRLAGLGDPPLRVRAALRRRRLDRLRRHRLGARRRSGRRHPDPDRHRDGRDRARLQDLARPLPPVDARRLPGGADPGHRLHGGGDQGRGVRRLRAPVRDGARPGRRELGGGARGACRDLDRGRQRRRPRPGLAEAAARLLGDRPGRLHAGRGRRLQRDRDQRARLLPRRLLPDEPADLRRDRRPRAGDRPRRRHLRARGDRAHRGPCSPGR